VVQQALAAQTLQVDAVLDPKTQQRAVHLAASKGRDAIVQLLLQHSADPAAVDGAGKTAAEIASDKGFSVIAANLQACQRRQQSAQAIQEQVKRKDDAAPAAPAAALPALNWKKTGVNDKHFMSLPMGATLSMYNHDEEAPANLKAPDATATGPAAGNGRPEDSEATRNLKGPGPRGVAAVGRTGSVGTADMSALFRSLPAGAGLPGEG